MEKWIYREHADTTYHLTQVLTGHGSFQKYLKKIGKANDSKCVYCETGEEDDVTHTVLLCPALEDARTEAAPTSRPSSVAELMNEMLESNEKWLKGIRLVEKVMKRKAEMEKERNERNRTGS